jgi:hypothetical protein
MATAERIKRGLSCYEDIKIVVFFKTGSLKNRGNRIFAALDVS